MTQRSLSRAASHSGHVLGVILWIGVSTASHSGCSHSPGSAAIIATGFVVVTPNVDVSTPEQTVSRTQEAVIRLKNFGSSEARVARVTTGCHCVTAKSLPLSPVLPGHECAILLEVTPPQYGEQSVQVSMHVTGEKLPLTATVRAKGRPLSVPRIVRPVADFTMNGTRTETLSTKFSILTVEKQGDTPWLSGFKPDNDDFKIDLDTLPEEQPLVPGLVQRKYTAVLSSAVEPQEPIDRFFAVTTMFHRQPTMKDASFRVHVHVEDPIRVFPAVINLRPRELPTRRELWLISNDNVSWNFDAAGHLPFWIHFSKSESQDLGANLARHRFILEFDSLDDADTTQATIVLTTTHPRHPQVEIPIYVGAE